MELLGTVKEWIRNIAVIIIVAGFLEIILPQSDLQRFARLVVGFFILLAIIRPLVDLFHQEVSLNTAFLDAAAAGSPDTAAVLAKGRELQAQHTRVALAEYRAALERQVTAMTTWLGAEVRTVAVDIVEDQSSTRFGAVAGIHLTIGTPVPPEEDSTVVPVAPVRIDFGSSPTKTGRPTAVVDPKLCATIARTLAGYYGLPTEAVTVTAAQ